MGGNTFVTDSPTTARRSVRRMTMAVLCGVALIVVACATPPALPIPQYRVTLVADGTEQVIATEATTVQGLLGEAGITLGDLDRVQPPETSALRDLMTVKVTRVEYRTHVLTQTVPFERQIVRDAAVPTGEDRLLQAGQTGLLERHYRITIEDAVETERVLVREEVVQAPEAEVRLIGARPQLENVTITGTLAYVSNQDAWVIRESSLQRNRMTSLGDLDGRVFALSPDAQTLLFTRSVTESEHINELWLVRTTEVSPNPVPLNITDVLWADWLPVSQRESRTIAWTTAEVTDQAPGWRGTNDLWTAIVTDKNTLSARQQVLEPESGGGYGWWGTRYAWSPDGRTLAYSRPDSVGLVDLENAATTQLLTYPPLRTFSSWSWNPELSWSPDGKFVAAVIHVADGGSESEEESPVFHLAVVSADGTISATLATEVGMWATPSFSPDGARLLFGRAAVPYQSATSDYTLQAIDRDGSNQTTIYAPQSYDGLDLPEWTWSPDGTSVAFIQLGDVMVLDLSTETMQALTNEGGATLLQWH